MKKDKVYLSKFFISQFAQFIILQILFAITAIFYGAGGHGIFIPLIIFYGPILIILSPLTILITSVEIQFAIIFLFFLLFFLIFYYKTPKKSVLKKILIFYFSIALIMIFYQIFNYGLESHISILNKFYATIISVILSFIFWRNLFKIIENKKQK